MASSDECSAGGECKRLMFEALDENSNAKLKLVVSAYSQMEILNSLLQQYGEKGETPLEFTIKDIPDGGSCVVELVKFLQDCDHQVDSKCQMLSVTVIDNLSNKIPILDLMESLITELCCVTWLEFIAQVFINSTSFIRQDKIIALELIGVSLISDVPSSYRPFHDSKSKIGLDYWREAMTLRYFPADGEPPLPKIPIVLVPSEASSAVFGSAVEVMTMEELNLLQEHIERNFYTLQNDVERKPLSTLMRVHALLVIRRICNQANQDGPYSLYLRLLLSCREGLSWDMDRTDFGQDNKLVMNICLLILEQMNGFDPEKISRNSFDVFSRTLCLLSTFFISMLEKPPGTPGREELSCANLLVPPKFFKTILKYFEAPHLMSFRHWDGFLDFGELFYLFLYVLDSISPQLNNREKQQLEEYYSTCIRCFFSEGSTTVLHAAVREILEYEDFNPIVSLKILRLTLKLGADPNVIDTSGKTPLHLLAADDDGLQENLPAFQALVDAGGHLDMATFNGDTVISILKQSLQNLKDDGSVVHPYYESLINTMFPLSCYCARVIRTHGIPFDEGRLPIRLQEFVSRHSATKDLDDLPSTSVYYMGRCI